MSKRIKGLLNGVGVVILVVLAMVYLVVRPIIVQNLEPVIREVASEKINGTLNWLTMDLDPAYNLQFNYVELKDSDGSHILTAPMVTVEWSAGGLYNYIKNGAPVLSVVTGVTAEQPHVSLKKHTDDSWNVRHILKPTEKEDQGEFTGRIHVTGGVFDVYDEDRKIAAIENGTANLSISSGNHITGTYSGSYLNASFDGDMDFKNGDNFKGSIRMEPVQLTDLTPLLDLMPSVMHSFDIRHGTGEVTSAKIWRSDGTLSYHIQGRLENAALGYDTYALTDGAAFFDVNTHVVTITGASGKINGQRFSGHGMVNLTEDAPSMEADVTAYDWDVAALLPDAGAKGSLSGSVHVSGTIDQPSAVGSVSVKDFFYDALNVADGRMSFSYGDHEVNISSLDAHAAGGKIQGYGAYNRENGSFSVSGTVHSVSLGDLPGSFDAEGIVSGDIAAAGIYGDGGFSIAKASFTGQGESVRCGEYAAERISGFADYNGTFLDGTFFAADVAAKGTVFDKVAGNVEKHGDMLYIPYISGAVGEGTFAASGLYSDGGMDLDVHAVNLDISNFSELSGMDLGGTLTADAKIEGTPDEPAAEGSFVMNSGHIGPAPFTVVSGKAHINGDNLALDGIIWHDGESRHHLSGTVGLSEDHALNLRVDSEKVRMEQVLSLAELSYPVTGWVENTMTIGGTLARPIVSGDFMAWDGSVMGELFQNLSGRYTWDNGNITISDGLGYIYDGAVTVNGTIEDHKLNFRVALVDIDAKRLMPEQNIKGKATLWGKVTGTMDHPEFSGSASSREIRIGGAILENLSTGVTYRDHLFSVDDGQFRQGKGTFAWKGSYHMNTSAVDGILTFKEWDMAEAAKMMGRPLSNASASMDGTMRVTGSISDPSVDLTAHVTGGYLGKAVIGPGEIHISYMDHGLSIKKFRIPVCGGVLAAEGSMPWSGALDMQVAAVGVDISWLPAVMDSTEDVGGIFTGSLSVKGTMEDPLADISIGIEKPRYGGYQLDEIAVMGNIQDGIISLQQAFGKKDEYRVSASGTLPVNSITRIPDDHAVPYDVHINLDKADMNLLALFFEPVTSASGPIAGRLDIKGRWDDPEVYGTISVEKGQFTLATVSDVVSPFALKAEFTGKKATVDSSAYIGGGKAEIDGSVAWDHGTIFSYDGHAGVNIPALKSVYFQGPLEGEFTLGDVLGSSGITGTVALHDDTINVPLSLFSGESRSIPGLMNISVKVGDRVRLYSPSLYNLTINGTVNAVGPFDAPDMSGRVNVEKGTIRVNMADFKINQGHAVWGRITGTYLPDVHVRASTHIGHYDITVEMDGPPGDMETVFHSEPYLNDSQILMLLALHQDPNSEENGAIEGALVNAGLTMILGNGAQDFLKDTIGLDLISVTSSLTDYYDSSTVHNDSYYYIKIGKYLFNDFMLTATTGLNNQEKSVGMHYDINSRLGISSWYNSERNSYFGVDWKFKF